MCRNAMLGGLMMTMKSCRFGFVQTNTFQAAILSDGSTTFVIYNYEKLTWTSGAFQQGNSKGLGGTEAQASLTNVPSIVE
jgi:Nidogen-like